jgi:hypothetical protein
VIERSGIESCRRESGGVEERLRVERREKRRREKRIDRIEKKNPTTYR